MRFHTLRIRLPLAAVLIATLHSGLTLAADAVLPPGDDTPLLRLETGGPRSYVSGLAFSPDSKTIYASGWDKAVLVWNQNAAGQYEFSSRATLRIPTGGGAYGGLNSLVLSPDGQWLAAAGQGYAAGMTGERESGWIFPAGKLNVESQLQQGLIYVFNTATRNTQLLRGHRGPVQSLTFVSSGPSTTPALVSVAEERGDDSAKYRPVVRFWNLAAGTEIGSLKSFPDDDGKTWKQLPDLKGFRPGLAAWSYGEDPKAARVAFAWGDDRFRIWDVRTGQVTTAPSNNYNVAVLPLPGSSARLLTGAQASIGAWSIPSATAERLQALKKEQFAFASVPSVIGKEMNLAGAMALIPARAGAPARVATIVTQYLPAARAEYRLLLLEIGPSIKVLREIPLPWTGEVRQAVVAVTRDGSRLAIAGNDRSEIETHLVSDLLGGNLSRGQTLASVGLTFRDAAFAKSDGNWGLRLSTEAGGAGGSKAIVANFRGRQMEPASDKWAPAVAAPGGWTIKPVSPGKLAITGPGQIRAEIVLEENYVATCQAIMPASAHCPVPLAAVGSHSLGQPRLELYRADTGEPLRWCVGHTERLTSLSFSEDGRMLVSTANDRVVSVWTVTDLAERTIDQHGRIPGLTLDSQGDRLIVREAPAELLLKPGDEIVGVMRFREPFGVETASDFYAYVLGLKPKTNLEVTIRRGGAVQTVPCPVAQAIDEAKPLFSMFISPAANGREWQWIGWHPLGNFDSRGDDVDRWLGWQFNTGDLERPARYAAIGDYRDTFYRRDLLPGLIDAQKLVAAAVVEDPQLSIWLEQADGTPVPIRGDEPPRVSRRDLKIRAEVTGVAAKSIQSVDVTVDGQGTEPLQAESDKQWSRDLSPIDWQRGLHRVLVRLKTKDREVTQVQRFHFAPAAPALQWVPKWNSQEELKVDEVLIDAAVVPATEPVDVRLILYRPGMAEPTVLKTWATTEPLKIDQRFPIEPGESRFELEARNSTAPENQRAEESIRQVALVRRAAPAEAPRITLDDVLTVSPDGATTTLTADQNLYSAGVPQWRLKGRITAKENIETATIEIAGTRRDLAKFQPASTREFVLDELLTLNPGRQDVVIRSTVGDQASEKRLTLAFLPAAPAIAEFTATVPPQKNLPPGIAGYLEGLYFEGYHEPSVTLTASLQGTLEHAYTPELLANDAPVDPALVNIDRSNPSAHRLTARIPLAGGRTSLTLRVGNEWTSLASSQAVDIDYRRPPRIDEVSLPERLEGVPLDLTAKIHSAIPLRSARVTVDESDEVPGVTIAPVEGEPATWRLTALKIGLAEGEHKLHITAANDDGVSLEPATRTVRMEKPPVAPPTLAILAPSPGEAALTVNSPQLELQYRVNSQSSAGVDLQILGNRDRFESLKQTVSPVEIPAEGLTQSRPIELFEGVNEITLQAFNDGGFSEKQILRVAYVPMAATVEITSIGDQKPQLRNDGTGYFKDPAAQSFTSLRGKVTLRDATAGRRNLAARIWVNRFKLPTVPIVMDESRPGTGTFSAEILFNKKEHNLIQVEVFSADGRVASELGCTNELLVDCDAPDSKQELYLLLLGTGDGEEVRQTARRTLDAKALTTQQASQEVWSSPTYNRIHVHDAMNAAPAAVQNRLRELIGKMHNNLKSGSQSGLHSVVMVLFQGKITLLDNDFALETAEASGMRTRPLTGQILEEYLTRTYGAHLIYLDLNQTEKIAERDVWPRAPHLGIMLFNWTGQGEKPADLRLLSVLERSLPQARFVRDLAQRIDRRYADAQTQYPGQIESVDLLKDLYDLRIGSAE